MLQDGTYDLQSGGGGVPLTGGSTLSTSPIYLQGGDYNLQPATDVMSYPSDSTATLDAATDDPYAQWGGQDAYNALVSGFNTQKEGIYDTSSEASGSTYNKYNTSILDYLDQLRLAQQGLNNTGTQNFLGKITGMRGILDMVGRGIRSGGVMLGNRNAGVSSGAEAIARAYGDIGRREGSRVGNQFEIAQNANEQSQQNLFTSEASKKRDFAANKLEAVNSIVANARTSFAELDAAMANASMPDRINIEAEKEKVRQQVLARLQDLDAQLSAGIAGVQPSSGEARRTEAFRLAGLGTAPENAFSFDTSVPAQFQGTGQFPSELPLFTLPRKRTA